jgi:hypothetical protein
MAPIVLFDPFALAALYVVFYRIVVGTPHGPSKEK